MENRENNDDHNMNKKDDTQNIEIPEKSNLLNDNKLIIITIVLNKIYKDINLGITWEALPQRVKINRKAQLIKSDTTAEILTNSQCSQIKDQMEKYVDEDVNNALIREGANDCEDQSVQEDSVAFNKSENQPSAAQLPIRLQESHSSSLDNAACASRTDHESVKDKEKSTSHSIENVKHNEGGNISDNFEISPFEGFVTPKFERNYSLLGKEYFNGAATSTPEPSLTDISDKRNKTTLLPAVNPNNVFDNKQSVKFYEVAPSTSSSDSIQSKDLSSYFPANSPYDDLFTNASNICNPLTEKVPDKSFDKQVEELLVQENSANHDLTSISNSGASSEKVSYKTFEQRVEELLVQDRSTMTCLDDLGQYQSPSWTSILARNHFSTKNYLNFLADSLSKEFTKYNAKLDKNFSIFTSTAPSTDINALATHLQKLIIQYQAAHPINPIRPQFLPEPETNANKTATQTKDDLPISSHSDISGKNSKTKTEDEKNEFIDDKLTKYPDLNLPGPSMVQSKSDDLLQTVLVKDQSVTPEQKIELCNADQSNKHNQCKEDYIEEEINKSSNDRIFVKQTISTQTENYENLESSQLSHQVPNIVAETTTQITTDLAESNSDIRNATSEEQTSDLKIKKNHDNFEHKNLIGLVQALIKGNNSLDLENKENNNDFSLCNPLLSHVRVKDGNVNILEYTTCLPDGFRVIMKIEDTINSVSVEKSYSGNKTNNIITTSVQSENSHEPGNAVSIHSDELSTQNKCADQIAKCRGMIFKILSNISEKMEQNINATEITSNNPAIKSVMTNNCAKKNENLLKSLKRVTFNDEITSYDISRDEDYMANLEKECEDLINELELKASEEYQYSNNEDAEQPNQEQEYNDDTFVKSNDAKSSMCQSKDEQIYVAKTVSSLEERCNYETEGGPHNFFMKSDSDTSMDTVVEFSSDNDLSSSNTETYTQNKLVGTDSGILILTDDDNLTESDKNNEDSDKKRNKLDNSVVIDIEPCINESTDKTNYIVNLDSLLKKPSISSDTVTDSDRFEIKFDKVPDKSWIVIEKKSDNYLNIVIDNSGAKGSIDNITTLDSTEIEQRKSTEIENQIKETVQDIQHVQDNEENDIFICMEYLTPDKIASRKKIVATDKTEEINLHLVEGSSVEEVTNLLEVADNNENLNKNQSFISSNRTENLLNRTLTIDAIESHVETQFDNFFSMQTDRSTEVNNSETNFHSLSADELSIDLEEEILSSSTLSKSNEDSIPDAETTYDEFKSNLDERPKDTQLNKKENTDVDFNIVKQNTDNNTEKNEIIIERTELPETGKIMKPPIFALEHTHLKKEVTEKIKLTSMKDDKTKFNIACASINSQSFLQNYSPGFVLQSANPSNCKIVQPPVLNQKSNFTEIKPAMKDTETQTETENLNNAIQKSSTSTVTNLSDKIINTLELNTEQAKSVQTNEMESVATTSKSYLDTPEPSDDGSEHSNDDVNKEMKRAEFVKTAVHLIEGPEFHPKILALKKIIKTIDKQGILECNIPIPSKMLAKPVDIENDKNIRPIRGYANLNPPKGKTGIDSCTTNKPNGDQQSKPSTSNNGKINVPPLIITSGGSSSSLSSGSSGPQNMTQSYVPPTNTMFKPMYIYDPEAQQGVWECPNSGMIYRAPFYMQENPQASYSEPGCSGWEPPRAVKLRREAFSLPEPRIYNPRPQMTYNSIPEAPQYSKPYLNPEAYEFYPSTFPVMEDEEDPDVFLIVDPPIVHRPYAFSATQKYSPRFAMNYFPEAIYVTTSGNMRINLKHNMQIDITHDLGIRVACPSSKIFLSISAGGGHVGMIHPLARCYQYDNICEANIYDYEKNVTRLAKMFDKQIFFSSSAMSRIYLLDPAGLHRNQKTNFLKLSYDFTKEVLTQDGQYGAEFSEKCADILYKAKYETCGMNHIIILQNIKIIQYPTGNLSVYRDGRSIHLQIWPNVGFCKIMTPKITMMSQKILTDTKNHFIVKEHEKKISFSPGEFMVRTEGQSAVIDSSSTVKLNIPM